MKFVVPAGLLVLLGLLAAPVEAVVFEFDSSVTLIGVLPGEREIASGTGVAEVSSSFGQLESLQFLGGHVAGTSVVPITDPLVSNGGLVKVEISAELPLSQSTLVGFDPFGGAFGAARVTRGTLPLRGERRNCLVFLECNPGFRQTLPFHTSLGSVGYGVGGVITVGGTGTVRISLNAAPFELGPTTLEVPTANSGAVTQVVAGFVHGPASNSFSGANTVGGAGGALQLVSPVRVTTVGSGGPGFGGHYVRLDIDFVPEPSLALGFGAAAFLLLRLARVRSRPRS